MALLAILIVLLALMTAAFVCPVRIRCVARLDSGGASVRLCSLYPLLKIIIFIEDNQPFVTVFVFKLKLYQRAIKRRKGKGNLTDWLRAADISDVSVDTRYGLHTPFATGIFQSILGIAAAFLKADSMQIYPDFIPDEEYVHIDASARVNIGNTIMNFAENKKNRRRKREWSKA